MNRTLFQFATILLLGSFTVAAYLGIGLWSLVLIGSFIFMRAILIKEYRDREAAKRRQMEIIEHVVKEMKERRRQRDLQRALVEDTDQPQPQQPMVNADRRNGQDGPAEFL